MGRREHKVSTHARRRGEGGSINHKKVGRLILHAPPPSHWSNDDGRGSAGREAKPKERNWKRKRGRKDRNADGDGSDADREGGEERYARNAYGIPHCGGASVW